MPVLGRRSLNRAYLARQLLLERHAMPVLDALEHLVGLQAQAPAPPYLGLWSRLDGFAFDDLAGALERRDAVRLILMRGTIHLVSARDAAIRALVQPLLTRAIAPALTAHLPDALDAARAFFAEAPRTDKEVRELIAGRWPDRDAAELARAVRYTLPLVQTPPRGLWGKSGLARHTTLDTWLDAEPPAPTIDALVLRYLGAFGPASVRDVQQWSGLTDLGEIVARLAPGLREFRDEDGRVLYDLPDAPRPDADTPAPVRLVPEFDNLTLSHADRARVVSDAHRREIFTVNGIIRATLLVDGFVHGRWKLEHKNGTATVTIHPFAPIPDEQAVADEAGRLASAAHPKADVRVEIAG